MNYSLGNMLSRGGALNPDGLALDLQFAADKTLTARKGPTPTFTRASTATFVGSDGLIQSAAINAPRFDHDPVTLACKGLLIEESRTNVLIQSDTLATQTITVTAAARTLSFYGTGTVVLSGAHIATVTGTGAYPTRTTLTFTPTAGSLILTVIGSVRQAQLEAGSFPTSYIPTTTTALTRSADVCSYSSVSSFYNSNEGTLVGQLNLYNPAPSIASELFRFGSGNDRVQLGVTNETGFAIRPFIVSGGVVNYSNNQGTSTVGTSRKTAIAFAANNAISCFNGTLGTQDTSVIMPAGITTAVIGASSFTGHIAAIRYYKKRLPNAKLQSLTT
jgi:hypothetical protein